MTTSINKGMGNKNIRSMAKILIVGYGALGKKLALKLSVHHQVMILKRQAVKSPVPHIDYIYADISKADTLHPLPRDFDVIFCVVSCFPRNVENYRQLYEVGINNLISYFASAKNSLGWFFVSSTSVYGQNQGEWVDEDSLTRPKTVSARYLLKAEQSIQQAFAKAIIVRFSGIYGEDRRRLLELSRTGLPVQYSPASYTNRIHEDDCLGILLMLFDLQRQGAALDKVYLASDDSPVSKWEVMNWLAELQHCVAPEKSNESVGQNKRCSNKKIKQLGYTFKYPSYKDGYMEIISAKH